MKQKIRRIALGTATLAGAALLPGAHAADNPFALKPLTGGYQLAQADTKAKEGKCGEGKCGAAMESEAKPKAKAKAKDAQCGAEHKKAADGKCGATKKKAGTKAKDGKCGEGKCSAAMTDGKKT